MANFEVCREPLLVDLHDPNVREAYRGMLDMYYTRYIDNETGVVVADEAAEIGRKLSISKEDLTYIGHRTLMDVLDCTAASFPFSWTPEGARLQAQLHDC